MTTPKQPGGKRTKKPKPEGILLFNLAYDLGKEDITYQTTMPLPQVLELVQNIMLAQQRQQGKREALAEAAKQKAESEKKEQ